MYGICTCVSFFYRFLNIPIHTGTHYGVLLGYLSSGISSEVLRVQSLIDVCCIMLMNFQQIFWIRHKNAT